MELIGRALSLVAQESPTQGKQAQGHSSYLGRGVQPASGSLKVSCSNCAPRAFPPETGTWSGERAKEQGQSQG